MTLGHWVDELEPAYRGASILLTGHTGFKGAWLSHWLGRLGASVNGYALAPEASQSLHGLLGARHDEIADIRSLDSVRRTVRRCRPRVIFHLAAQALVRQSFEQPLETITTNIVGTANLLEAVRLERARCAIVIVTSDKCYENQEWDYAYRESDALGGKDIYSMSKGGAELVSHSYRSTFFPLSRANEHGVFIATARAGNVIGGGDWSRDRLIPDAITALVEGRPIGVRNPRHIRPWQHVLEPLGGYLLLGMRLMQRGDLHSEGWNFGPTGDCAVPVREVVEAIVSRWGSGSWVNLNEENPPPESTSLRLSIDKAHARLHWFPAWSLATAIGETVDWYRKSAATPADSAVLCSDQIDRYIEAQRGLPSCA